VPVHLYVAHAPYTLILLGAGLDLFGVVTGREPHRQWAGVLLMLGALGAFVAFFTGQAAVPYALARGQAVYPLVEVHSQWGGAGVWVLVVCGGLRAAWRHRVQGPYGWANLGTALISAALIVAITRSGFAIAHGG
jgi:uncharacterized membrane protein